MGFNTTIVIYNDHLDVIENDPEFGKKLVQAIQKINFSENSVTIMANSDNCSATVGQVIESHHADYEVVVSVGKNRGKML